MGSPTYPLVGRGSRGGSLHYPLQKAPLTWAGARQPSRSHGAFGTPRTGGSAAGAPKNRTRRGRPERTGGLARPCPLNVGLFGAGSDGSPPSNPGLPAGTWGSQHLLLVCMGAAYVRVSEGRGPKVGSASPCGSDPLPRGEGRVFTAVACDYYKTFTCVPGGNTRVGRYYALRAKSRGLSHRGVSCDTGEMRRRYVASRTSGSPAGCQSSRGPAGSSKSRRVEVSWHETCARAAARRARGACAGSSSPR